MKPHYIFFVLFFASLSPLLAGGSSLVEVFQPTSRFGTEKADPVIVSRPVIVGNGHLGAVNAISLPHHIAGAPEEFPKESNLIVLVGATVYVALSKDEHFIVADFSKAKNPKNSEVTVLQVMKMTALCLQKTLGNYQGEAISIRWAAPKGISIIDTKLPQEITKMENNRK